MPLSNFLDKLLYKGMSNKRKLLYKGMSNKRVYEQRKRSGLCMMVAKNNTRIIFVPDMRY